MTTVVRQLEPIIAFQPGAAALCVGEAVCGVAKNRVPGKPGTQFLTRLISRVLLPARPGTVSEVDTSLDHVDIGIDADWKWR